MERKAFNPRPYQELMIDFAMNTPRCALWAGMGMGKQQPISEPVLTPDGWRPIGSVRAGDYVIGRAGRPTEVLEIFPQGVKDVYRVGFTDGSWTRAGLEHLWKVCRPKDKNKWRVLSTAQLIAAGLHTPHGNRKYFVPLVGAIEYSRKELPVAPYLLGVLLGDGHLPKGASPSITTDEEVLRNFTGRLTAHKSEGIAELALTGQDLLPKLRALGLAGCRSWEKFVPDAYLRGDPAQRLALLQGLLDTDGSALSSGGVEFASTSKALIDSVVELAESLGGIARQGANGRYTRYQGGLGRESWRVNVKLPAHLEPFRLSRKLAAYVPPTKYPPVRGIAAITHDGIEESVCIRVAAEDALYVTRRHIVTHNTSSALTVVERRLMFDDSPTLVLAPLLVAKTSWVDEARKWSHLSGIRVVPVIGTEVERRRALAVKAEVYAINYEQLPWLVEYFGDRWPFKHVIADESTKLKSFRTRQGGKRARALAQVAHSRIKSLIELTGTPSPNGLIDLWGQIWMIDKGARLGRSFTSFTERWFKSERRGDHFAQSILPHSEGEIHHMLQDICMTVNPKDWFDLKEPIVSDKYVELPRNARKLYDEMEKAFFIELEGHQVEATNAAIKSGKLLQLANGAVYVDPLVDSDHDPRSTLFKEVHDAKIQALESIVNEAAGMPVLVATNFKSDQTRLLKAFPKSEVLTSANGAALMPKWNRGEIPILFAHPASAGHGLNLQNGGNILVFYGLGWNLEHRLQMLERIGPVRQLQAGHDRPVFIYNIVAKDTIDELVTARVESKREVQDILLEAMARRNR